ncbi:MAG: ABC transporter permease, partial [Bacteroidota bacterium]
MPQPSPDILPPKKAQQFLNFFLKDELAEEVVGDLEELFYARLESSSPAQARRSYWYQVFNYLRPFAIKNFSLSNLNHLDMFSNYLKIGYRQLWRNKSAAVINISGLAIGITVALLIGLWAHDELTFDQHQSNYSHVHQVMQQQTVNGNIRTQEVVPYPLSATLRTDYGSYFKYMAMSSDPSEHIVISGNEKARENGVYMESDAPYLLDLQMVSGTREDLREPNAILVSKTMAKKLFGTKNPIDQPLKIDNEAEVVIKGIYEDLPVKSTFGKLAFIANWEQFVNTYDWVRNARDKVIWDHNSFRLYAETIPDVDPAAVNQKIKNAKYDRVKESQKVFKAAIFLHPMKDWHLRSNWEAGVKTGGPIRYVYLFTCIGLIVLILACINFMNLSTAQAGKRAKEVGVRKSLGSLKRQLVSQFLSESFLVVSLAFLLAIGCTLLSLSAFNELAGKQIIFPYKQPVFWGLAMVFILLTSFLAGSYPAFFLSSFQPVKVLKGNFKSVKSTANFRRGLVVVQFTVSVILIIGTLVVQKQIEYTTNRPLGYDEQGLIMTEILTEDYYGKYHLLKDELLKRGAIEHLAFSSSPLTEVWNNTGGYNWEGKPAEFNPQFSTIWVSHDFGPTVGWEITQGRDFSRQFATDSTAFIIN